MRRCARRRPASRDASKCAGRPVRAKAIQASWIRAARASASGPRPTSGRSSRCSRVPKTKGRSRAWQEPSMPAQHRRGPGEQVGVGLRLMCGLPGGQAHRGMAHGPVGLDREPQLPRLDALAARRPRRAIDLDRASPGSPAADPPGRDGLLAAGHQARLVQRRGLRIERREELDSSRLVPISSGMPRAAPASMAASGWPGSTSPSTTGWKGRPWVRSASQRRHRVRRSTPASSLEDIDEPARPGAR